MSIPIATLEKGESLRGVGGVFTWD